MHGSPYANTKNYVFLFYFLCLCIWENYEITGDVMMIVLKRSSFLKEKKTIFISYFPKKAFDEELAFFDWEWE